jgi:hypothetical protein
MTVLPIFILFALPKTAVLSDVIEFTAGATPVKTYGDVNE